MLLAPPTSVKLVINAVLSRVRQPSRPRLFALRPHLFHVLQSSNAEMLKCSCYYDNMLSSLPPQSLSIFSLDGLVALNVPYQTARPHGKKWVR